MQEDTVTASGGIALGGCCIGPMASNATKVGDATGNMGSMKADSGVGVHGVNEVVPAAITTWFAGGSTITSIKTAIDYSRLITRANHALEDLDVLARVHGETQQIKALRQYVEGERRTFRFQNRVAGYTTAADSAVLLTGQYVHPLYPVALYGASTESLVRAGDSGRFIVHGRNAIAIVDKGSDVSSKSSLAFHEDERNIRMDQLRTLHALDLLSKSERRISDSILNSTTIDDAQLRKLTDLRPDQKIVREHFSDQQSVGKKNAAGWALICSGTASVGTNSVLKDTSPIVEKALVFSGIGEIMMGTGITYRYNPRLYGPEFSPGLPERLTQRINQAANAIRNGLEDTSLAQHAEPMFFSDQEIRSELLKSQRLHVVAREYQQVSAHHQSLLAKSGYAAMALGKHLGSLLSVGVLPSRYYAGLNRFTKEVASGWYKDERALLAERIAFVQKLNPDYRPGQTSKIATDNDTLLLKTYEDILTDARNPAVGGIANILLRRILETAPKSTKTFEEDPLQQIEIGDTNYRIKNDMLPLFEFRDAKNNIDQNENIDCAKAIKEILNTPPCCESGSWGAIFLGQLFDRYAKDISNADETKRQAQFATLLQHSVDQYMTYQLPADRSRERCFWSNLAHVTGASRRDGIGV